MKLNLKRGPKQVTATDPKMLKILELIKTGYTASAACEEVGIVRGTFYNWLKRQPEPGPFENMGVICDITPIKDI